MIYEKLLIQADNLKLEKRFGEAISLYKEAIEMGAEEAGCYFDIANCFDLLKDEEKAIFYYRKGLAIDPNNEQATFILGLIYYFGNQDNAALLTFRKLLEINPNKSEAHYFIGLIEKDLNIAISHLELALSGQLNETDALSATISLQQKFMLVGVDFALHGKPQKAQEYTDKALKLGKFEENNDFFKEIFDIMK